jgi:hypothetical protein
MELEAVKRYLEKGGNKNASTIDGLPLRFFERFTMQGLRLDLIEPGRLICSFKVPSRLLVGFFFFFFLFSPHTPQTRVVGLFDTDPFHCMRKQPSF